MKQDYKRKKNSHTNTQVDGACLYLYTYILTTDTVTGAQKKVKQLFTKLGYIFDCKKNYIRKNYNVINVMRTVLLITQYNTEHNETSKLRTGVSVHKEVCYIKN